MVDPMINYVPLNLFILQGNGNGGLSLCLSVFRVLSSYSPVFGIPTFLSFPFFLVDKYIVLYVDIMKLVQFLIFLFLSTKKKEITISNIVSWLC